VNVPASPTQPARIVSIHHNCFVLQAGGKTLLFDYPAPQFLPREAADVAAPLLEASDLTVFTSHSHDDHFDPDILAVTQRAATRRFVVADDVADRFGDRLPADTVVLEPDDVRVLDGMRVEALESNDMGVAFRIDVAGIAVYFGGDLALWDWPGQSPAAARAVAMSWRLALKKIASRPVDVAFSNMDPRLASLAGAAQFVAAVRPRIFVPMHLGGHTAYIDRYAATLAHPGTAIFHYAAPGDALQIEERGEESARGETL
jgi:L-ascorbate metabolism protein UlaG (beta-lactamase superfamily)